jgi:hypothetical protein
MIDWSVFASVVAALVFFEVAKGAPGFVRGFVAAFRKARVE